MKGSDLRCPTCGGSAIDVAPDFETFPEDEIGTHTSAAWTSATCAKGHRFCLCERETFNGIDARYLT